MEIKPFLKISFLQNLRTGQRSWAVNQSMLLFTEKIFLAEQIYGNKTILENQLFANFKDRATGAVNPAMLLLTEKPFF